MVADSPDENKLRNITVPFYADQERNIRKFIPQKEQKQIFTFNKRRHKLDQEHTLHYGDIEKERKGKVRPSKISGSFGNQ